MDRQAVVARLRDNEAELPTRGVAHPALFGSCARGQERADSDTDIMIGIDPEVPVGIRQH
jgi:predicted nucleotidyltransferase